MSEKRFTIEKIFKEYPKLRDNETECFYHLVDNERNAEIFCERLNNLVEENEQLQQVLSENEKMLQKDLDMLTELRKENKRKDIEITSLNSQIKNWCNETEIAKLYEKEQDKTEMLEKAYVECLNEIKSLGKRLDHWQTLYKQLYEKTTKRMNEG